MISNKIQLTLEFSTRNEVEAGVFEDKLTDIDVRATKIQIYQKRLIQAMNDSVVVTGRYRIRDNYNLDSLKYIIVGGNRYKINTIYSKISNHYVEIEAGEQV
jgi:hypothetical protein